MVCFLPGLSWFIFMVFRGVRVIGYMCVVCFNILFVCPFFSFWPMIMVLFHEALVLVRCITWYLTVFVDKYINYFRKKQGSSSSLCHNLTYNDLAMLCMSLSVKTAPHVFIRFFFAFWFIGTNVLDEWYCKKRFRCPNFWSVIITLKYLEKANQNI